MELTGVDRLLAVARELGVKAAGPSAVRERANPPAPARGGEDGIRLSLSSPASGEGAAGSRDAAHAVASGNPTAPPVAAPTGEAPRALQRADGRLPARGSALDAYRRSAGSAGSTPLGARIRIRA